MLQTISVTMDEVRLEVNHNNAGCYDYVRLYDIATTSSSVIGSYCTTPNPSTVTSSSSAVLVVFISDRSNHGGKFSLSWTFVDGGTGPVPGEFTFFISFLSQVAYIIVKCIYISLGVDPLAVHPWIFRPSWSYCPFAASPSRNLLHHAMHNNSPPSSNSHQHESLANVNVNVNVNEIFI